MNKAMFKQLMEIRKTGLCNMFGANQVIAIAKRYEYYALARWIKNNPKEYFHMILTGEIPFDHEDPQPGINEWGKPATVDNAPEEPSDNIDDYLGG
jgi:hypothetical protein